MLNLTNTEKNIIIPMMEKLAPECIRQLTGIKNKNSVILIDQIFKESQMMEKKMEKENIAMIMDQICKGTLRVLQNEDN
jgi:hypothetical protein